ncbi:ATPase, AAA family protein [Rhizodiscina lignyota]|uniref:ATPase, AAA family protein n=1 Tax=Rhizodiscina lignyota TaxID=1504668 RepID=A0A9P4I4P2_9PEZI|nr:ATPase, AAA family protein [Rhizodiscina lignyota]
MEGLTLQLSALQVRVSPQARLSYLALASICRRKLSSTRLRASSDKGQFKRSDFGSQPFTGIYEPDQPTGGPLGGASIVGAPRITPKLLKQHLDQFVVGQERAKKVLSTAVYNHYQRIQEIQRQDDEHAALQAQQERQQMRNRHPVEDEFPGQQQTSYYQPPPFSQHSPLQDPASLQDDSPLTLEKSNVLLLGPSGSGKTLMAKTLARVLSVPFSMSDCTPLTQAGYIGEDADVCVARLLAAANYDVAKAESGIICLDEIDKIATAKVSHGKDVSGEGVQQALLKIVEGTTVQVIAKNERGSGPGPGGSGGKGSPNVSGGFPSQNPVGGGGPGPGQPGGKGEVYNVRTDNILFVFTGAFIGLHKMIMDRISRGSIGFGASIRSANPETGGVNDTMIRGEDEMFKKHLPFYTPESESTPAGTKPEQLAYNSLDLLEPPDLQKYGLIPELIGRIPISCALSSLDEAALVRVLTEPRNALLKQYEQQFGLSGIELRFTTAALWEVAKTAVGMGTGARGLRTVCERILGDAMFETPGTNIKHILITGDVAKKKAPPMYFPRGSQAQFYDVVEQEERAWTAEHPPDGSDGHGDSEVGSFEEYREKARVAGVV